MKPLFKKTKVVYDAHLDEYIVYYKNFLFWKYDRTYKIDRYMTNETAKDLAITYAKNILSSVEVYRS
jgi:hypothetical protein